MFQAPQTMVRKPLTRLQLVLMAKHPNGEWAVRNRCPALQSDVPKLKAELRKLRSEWEQKEPETRFKLKWMHWVY